MEVRKERKRRRKDERERNEISHRSVVQIKVAEMETQIKNFRT